MGALTRGWAHGVNLSLAPFVDLRRGSAAAVTLGESLVVAGLAEGF